MSTKKTKRIHIPENEEEEEIENIEEEEEEVITEILAQKDSPPSPPSRKRTRIEDEKDDETQPRNRLDLISSSSPSSMNDSANVLISLQSSSSSSIGTGMRMGMGLMDPTNHNLPDDYLSTLSRRVFGNNPKYFRNIPPEDFVYMINTTKSKSKKGTDEKSVQLRQKIYSAGADGQIAAATPSRFTVITPFFRLGLFDKVGLWGNWSVKTPAPTDPKLRFLIEDTLAKAKHTLTLDNVSYEPSGSGGASLTPTFNGEMDEFFDLNQRLTQSFLAFFLTNGEAIEIGRELRKKKEESIKESLMEDEIFTIERLEKSIRSAKCCVPMVKSIKSQVDGLPERKCMYLDHALFGKKSADTKNEDPSSSSSGTDDKPRPPHRSQHDALQAHFDRDIAKTISEGFPYHPLQAMVLKTQSYLTDDQIKDYLLPGSILAVELGYRVLTNSSKDTCGPRPYLDTIYFFQRGSSDHAAMKEENIRGGVLDPTAFDTADE